MKYFPIPVAMLEIGKPLPVDVWSASGNLLLRKGQPVLSEQHREKLDTSRRLSSGSPMRMRSCAGHTSQRGRLPTHRTRHGIE